MIFLQLFVTFFQIGLFGFGGGYGMLSLIQGEVVHHWGWMTTSEFTDIVAISQMTPGPIGINSATYCGYTAVHNAGMGETMAVLGSCVSTFALVLPSLILMMLIAKMFLKYMKHPAPPWWVCSLPPRCCCARLKTSQRRKRIPGSSGLARSSSWLRSWAPRCSR